MTDSKRKRIIREHVVRRDGLGCCFCDKPLSIHTATLEHIVPVSKRGSFNRSNLTISCERCNSNRGDKNFFDYISRFPVPEYRLLKYRRLYSNNLKIKVLNVAKENCIKNDIEIPSELIVRACEILKIDGIDFTGIEGYFEIQLDVPQPRNKIRRSFENVIKIIEQLYCRSIMFKPIRDVIIVKKLDASDISKGGIYIPKTVENAAFVKGLVVATGDGILTESGNIVDLKVKTGDKVVYGKSGGLDIQIDGEDFVMMRESNILGTE